MLTLYKVKKRCYNYSILLLIWLLIILPTLFPLLSIFIYFSISILYLISNFIKIFLFFFSFFKYNPDDYYKKDNLKIGNENLPIYSILLPVRKEKEFVIINLLNSMNNLDYPKDKLDIKLIIDEGDIETVKIGKKLFKDFNFDLIIVPEFIVKSKPISCNYALKFVCGKFLTIYDAEDRPEKYQLKKAIEKFTKLGEDFVCLQSSLNYYNKYDNFLSYCFSIEYSMWFDFTVKEITRYSTFFPLGGTSNHFRTEKLLELGSWDGYNVTEDAELGVRIARAGYKVGNLNSITEEESPVTIKAWLKQRTRWIKGFMQTFFEYLAFERPIAIKSNVKFKKISELKVFDILTFIIFVGMSFFFFISIIAVFFNHVILLELEKFKYLTPVIYTNIFSLFFMIYGAFILIVIKNKMKFNFLYFLFFPLYWILYYVAAVWAIYGLIKTPFYWAKTEHGVSKSLKKF